MIRHGLVLEEGPTASLPVFHARVTLAHASRLWERAVRALGPDVPLLVAQKSPDDHISPLYFAAMGCRTMGEALALVVKHWRYATDALHAQLTRRAGALHLHLAAAAEPSLGARLGLEYLLADLVRTGRELSGGAWRPAAVVLGHRPPVGLDVWERHCGVPVRIDPDAPGLAIDEASLDQPVRATIAPAASRFFVELLDWYTPPVALQTSASERVAQLLARELGASAPSVDRVAHALALSTRSLHRQLAAEGTSYQRLLDGLRREEAMRQALDDRRPLKAIAAAVGFSDPRGFRRAFKRWTGTTPQVFRRTGAITAAASAGAGASQLEAEHRADP